MCGEINFSGIKTELIYLDESFIVKGPQMMSERIVKMTCKNRNDNGPARFIVSEKVIPATVDNLIEHEQRGVTSIGKDGVKVKQIEHILSALYSMNALDTDIFLEYEEEGVISDFISPPAAQLNSREFTHAILSCFLSKRDQKPERFLTLDKSYYFIEDSTSVTNGDPGVALFAPLHKLHITTQINFSGFLDKQIYSETITPLNYAKSICWARSFFGTPFPHKSEMKELQARYPQLVREQSNYFRSIMIDYDDEKWLTPVVVNTEPVRHKMLDFLGELALLGLPIKAGIHIYKPSHQFNRNCVIKLAQEISSQQFFCSSCVKKKAWHSDEKTNK